MRNKYCSICARGQALGKDVTDHLCFKNWGGSSAAMEADIIVDGFNHSVAMHNVLYKKFIADGDSSVFAQIKRKVHYGTEVCKWHSILCTLLSIMHVSF